MRGSEKKKSGSGGFQRRISFAGGGDEMLVLFLVTFLCEFYKFGFSMEVQIPPFFLLDPRMLAIGVSLLSMSIHIHDSFKTFFIDIDIHYGMPRSELHRNSRFVPLSLTNIIKHTFKSFSLHQLKVFLTIMNPMSMFMRASYSGFNQEPTVCTFNSSNISIPHRVKDNALK